MVVAEPAEFPLSFCVEGRRGVAPGEETAGQVVEKAVPTEDGGAQSPFMKGAGVDSCST